MSSRQTIYFSMISLLFLTLTISQAMASADWETRLSVRSGSGENRLSFGQRSDATAGVDGQYEVPSMPGGNLNAWFALEGGAYWRDIKGASSGEQAQWALKVDSSPSAGVVTISWGSTAFPAGSLVLHDIVTGAQIDMKQSTSYSYSSNGPREFLLIAGP